MLSENDGNQISSTVAKVHWQSENQSKVYLLLRVFMICTQVHYAFGLMVIPCWLVCHYCDPHTFVLFVNRTCRRPKSDNLVTMIIQVE